MSRRIAACLLLAAGPLCAGTVDEQTCLDSASVSVTESGGTNGVRAVIAVDLDADGDADVVSASQNDDQIAWFEWNGTAFLQHEIDGLADGASALFAIDLDLDGDPDVLAASMNDDTIAWHENTSETPPRFVKHVVTTSANSPSSVHAVDMDGDDDIDVVSASANDDTLAWYENDGSSLVFTRHVITTAADGASSIFAIDVDEDGRMDVVYAARQSDVVAWCRNTLVFEDPEDPEDTGVQVWVDIVLASNVDGAAAVQAVDLDEDGDVDVLSASTNDDKIAWYDSDGALLPHHEKRLISAGADGATSVFAIDVDGDGDLDVLSASRNSGRVEWYQQTAPSTFDPLPSLVTISPGASSVHATADADVVSAGSIAGAIALEDEIRFHPNQGLGVFGPHLVVSGATIAPVALVTADLDGGGALDLVVASATEHSISWFAGPAFAVRNEITDAVPGVTSVYAADLGIPGAVDVVAAWGNTISWYRSEDSSAHVITSDAEGASSVFAANLDGANGLDVLAASSGDDTISWYESGAGPTPTFTEHVLTQAAAGASAVVAGDIDGDALLDVIYASAEDDTVAWFRNTALPATRFADEETISGTSDSPRALAVGDIDGDLRLDVVVASSADDAVAWYRNILDEADPEDPEDEDEIVWLKLGVTGEADFPRTLSLVDLNEDGLLDVAVGSSGDDTVAWYEQVRTAGTTPEDPAVVTFLEHVLSTSAKDVRAVAAGPLDGNASVDIAVGALSLLAYHPGGAEETCQDFDVNADEKIDGLELGWLGLAFGEYCEGTPWWAPIDLNDDCLVDGEDLAILTSTGVWGRSTVQEDPFACHFTCPVTDNP